MEKVKFVHGGNLRPSICLYEIRENYLRAAFLQKSKPEVGDLFQTFTKGDTGFRYTYRIINIIKQSDSKTLHEHNKDALFELEINMLNIRGTNGIITGELKDGTVLELN